ncbi:hypothetical protein PTTG_06211 [Puccinia triticina 1-1 BBBD Race 1]|uniref:Retrotransposon gag domain-containing protein n=1 Tax=Puccinia triticina (isolate 1-1 / race 1 (BBBD)) TaxID=630390 RepID=A0A180GQE9_PUCT1|nr:hypothetical protein PTTG_06211 [Puccinia triticina 1-1 BBBD Race 1]
MSTRQSNTDPLLPLQDPEQLAREIRRRARIEAALAAPTAINVPSPDNPSTNTMQNQPSNPQGSAGEQTEPAEMSNNDLIQAILVLQQNTAKQLLAAQEAAQAAQAQARAELKAVQAQARADVKAALDAWSRNTGPKLEGSPSPQTAPGRIDLQRFKISDGPLFKGPFQDVEVFLRWIQGVQIFFTTKAVTHADDKRIIIGGLIVETNLLSFYANKAAKFEGKSWEEFRKRLFEFALPVEWKTALKRNIAQLKMSESETFLEFSTRACTLQSLVNFDAHTQDDHALAEAVTFGLPEALQAKIDDHQILQSANFKYGKFKSRTSGFYTNLVKTSVLRLRQTAHTANGTNRTIDTVWRLHAYLDSLGLCHFCKKHCGSTPRSCPNTMDKSRVEIPASFVTPPKPADYVPPVAWSSKNQPSTKTGQQTAGRPAGVAGLSNEAPDLDKLSAACLTLVDGEVQALSLNYTDTQEVITANTQAAAMAGDPDAIVQLTCLAATRDDEFIPEDPHFNEASLLDFCHNLPKPRDAEYVPSPARNVH